MPTPTEAKSTLFFFVKNCTNVNWSYFIFPEKVAHRWHKFILTQKALTDYFYKCFKFLVGMRRFELPTP